MRNKLFRQATWAVGVPLAAQIGLGGFFGFDGAAAQTTQPVQRQLSVSPALKKAAQTMPFLKDINKTVFLIDYGVSLATGVLLDDAGTVVSAGHVVEAAYKPRMLILKNMESGAYDAIDARVYSSDDKTDTSFFQIDPAKIRELGLKPLGLANWGAVPDAGAGNPSFPLIHVGFANGNQLAMVEGRGVVYTDSIQATYINNTSMLGLKLMGTFYCKDVSHGANEAGMSGGPSFGDGRFMGIVTIRDRERDLTYFTPSYSIRYSYAKLVPYAAKAAGIEAVPLQNPSCQAGPLPKPKKRQLASNAP